MMERSGRASKIRLNRLVFSLRLLEITVGGSWSSSPKRITLPAPLLSDTISSA